MDMKKLKGVIESILFTFGDAVELKKIASAIEQDEDTTRNLIYELMKTYDKAEHGIKIIELGDAFQMCTKPETYDYLIRIAKQPKKITLSDVQLETLSIVAYRQPVTKLEIEKIRGVNSNHAMNKLVEIGLIEEVGRLDAPGKPLLFGTTEEFFRRFGIQSLDDLPKIGDEQIEHFKEEAEDEALIKLNL